MADVFVSYSREDRAKADQIAQALQRNGVQVFWDSEIPPGQTWADYIEEKLTQCKVVLVLWSAHSTKSQWVREEARIGRDKGKLIPLMIDKTPAPFGFGEVQAADLSAWNGHDSDPNWARVVEAVRTAANKPASAAPRPAMGQPTQAGFNPARSAPAPQPEKRGGVHPIVWVLAGGGGLLVFGLLALFVIGMIAQTATTQQASNTPVIEQPVEQPTQQPVMQQPTQTEAQYHAQVQTQMGAIQQAMGSQGFQQIGTITMGQLRVGQTQDIPMELYVGYEYRVAATCDNDCSDLDLTLYDGYGNVISQDNAADDHPIVPVVVTGSGSFTVRASMYACSVEPCYYGAALFGRAAQ
jgi:hypothetical protein